LECRIFRTPKKWKVVTLAFLQVLSGFSAYIYSEA
jgi:hypothetical protein